MDNDYSAPCTHSTTGMAGQGKQAVQSAGERARGEEVRLLKAIPAGTRTGFEFPPYTRLPPPHSLPHCLLCIDSIRSHSLTLVDELTWLRPLLLHPARPCPVPQALAPHCPHCVISCWQPHPPLSCSCSLPHLHTPIHSASQSMHGWLDGE